MAREHLFRGFHECADGDTVIMIDGEQIRGTWVEGGHIKGYRHCTSPYAPIDYEVHYIAYYDKEQQMFIDKEIIPETVGEYTGLTDKNGKKIFEDDICGIFCNTQIFEVKYCKERCGYFFDNCILSGYAQPAPECLGNLKNTIEVIGNIFKS